MSDVPPTPSSGPEPETGGPLRAVPVPPGQRPPHEGEGEGEGDGTESITEPGKLLRIASMVHELLAETRGSPLDEQGRTRLRQIYERSIEELSEVLPDPLEKELRDFVLPLEGVPTESEIRVAQAQLVGWLEGLFHGIQAAIVAQQQAAMQQLAEFRRRGLPGGLQPGVPGQADPRGDRPGPYL